MLLLKYLVGFAACLGLAAARGKRTGSPAVILRNINTLKGETSILHTELARWDMQLGTAHDVVAQTDKVLKATLDAVRDINEHSPRLNPLGALKVGSETQKLVEDIAAAMKTIAKLAPAFDKIELATTVMNTIKAQSEASAAMNDAVYPRIPPLFRMFARKMRGALDQIFTLTIAAYAKLPTVSQV